MTILLFTSLVSLVVVVYSAVFVAVGVLKMRRLSDVSCKGSKSVPRVSVVVPACNEEKNIEKAILSLLAQEYSKLEIVVVNDRSIDNTGLVLENLQRQHPALTIHTITDVPEGWMGKSHALAEGAKLAAGEILVFTDADVLMEKTTIARAVNYGIANQLDHLSLLFKNTTRGCLLNGLILDAGMGLFLVFKPWMVRKRGSKHFIGVGAFNMIKKSVYKDIGGHQTIRMHPIDDVMLGKRVKQNGYRQDCLLAQDHVTVPWYGSVKEMVNGLLKNTFSVVHYRALLVPLQLLLIFVASVFPFWGAVWGEGSVQVICLLSAAVRLTSFYCGLAFLGLPAWYLAGALLTPFISGFIIIKSSFTTIRNKGIVWRGKFYPLRDLRKAKPLFF